MQKKRKLISCPSCESSNIKKALVAPNVSKKSNAKISKQKKTMINNIKKYKKIIEKNFDYVGDNFTEEAKKIKYGESEERPIYGEASLEQAKELIDKETIHGGMIPKIKTCIDAINNGVRAVAILDGRKPHSILFELFSDKGSGTLIRKWKHLNQLNTGFLI